MNNLGHGRNELRTMFESEYLLKRAGKELNMLII